MWQQQLLLKEIAFLMPSQCRLFEAVVGRVGSNVCNITLLICKSIAWNYWSISCRFRTLTQLQCQHMSLMTHCNKKHVYLLSGSTRILIYWKLPMLLTVPQSFDLGLFKANLLHGENHIWKYFYCTGSFPFSWDNIWKWTIPCSRLADGPCSQVHSYWQRLGHYFLISWFTDFLAAKTGRSVGKK